MCEWCRVNEWPGICPNKNPTVNNHLSTARKNAQYIKCDLIICQHHDNESGMCQKMFITQKVDKYGHYICGDFKETPCDSDCAIANKNLHD